MLLAAGLRGAVLAVVAGVAVVVGTLVAVIAKRSDEDEDTPEVRELAGKAVAGIVAGAQRSPSSSHAVEREQGLAQKIPAKEAIQGFPRVRSGGSRLRRRSGEDSRG